MRRDRTCESLEKYWCSCKVTHCNLWSSYVGYTRLIVDNSQTGPTDLVACHAAFGFFNAVVYQSIAGVDPIHLLHTPLLVVHE